MLSCNENQLTVLDVSKNTELITLSCNENQLTALDVSKNTALTWLSCRDNNMVLEDSIVGLSFTKVDKDVIGRYCFYPQKTLDPINTASEWARAEIISAVEKGFVPEELQYNYTTAITRQEFCWMAVLFV